MARQKFSNLVLAILVIASLVLGGFSPAQALEQAPAPVEKAIEEITIPEAPAAAPIDPVDETLVPHYFGPYPNWANSPQVLADAVVTITPNVGEPDPGTIVAAEATASVDPRTGVISGVTITSPGTGYTLAPNVAITSTTPGMPTTPAVANAEISLGVLSSITVDNVGFGYTAPAVTITGGTPNGGVCVDATAEAYGGVDSVFIADPGELYVIEPIVVFGLPDDPNGIQAQGVADMVDGAITGVYVVNPGSGYKTAPTVRIDDGNNPPVGGLPAVVTSTISVDRIDVTCGSAGYDTAPTVTITDLTGTGADASATANLSDLGSVTKINVTSKGAGYLTPGLKKFIDPLPGLCVPTAGGLGTCSPLSTSKQIPVGVPDQDTYPGTDYYEIGLVQYRMKFSSQLPATLLRGYVQLSSGTVLGGQVVLSNANVDPLGVSAPIVGYTGVTNPHYLGPTIIATKDRPVRIVFRNLLPTGEAGNLFLPVDSTLMGAGEGPNAMTLDANNVVEMDPLENQESVTDLVRNPACGEPGIKPNDCFAENRATLHLHGGITPWISDGTPHQWITPAGEATDYPEGVSVKNVPDMDLCRPDDDGCQTFFYTNQQSARLMFYHDHAWGITRLNVYAGEAAGYVITDDTEQKLFVDDTPLDPGTNTAPFKDLGIGTPLIIQDKTFVSDKILQQDPTWQSERWGGTGSLWAPHVYMPAQNPGDVSGMSGYGRWMYGPWFWPPAGDAKYAPIPNPYYGKDPDGVDNIAGNADDWQSNLAVPCNIDDEATWQYTTDPFCEPALIPGTPNVSVGMEAFNDTPLVNGTVYPYANLEPKAYRFRILNAANDRFWNLSWYVADPRTGTLSEVALNPAELAAAQNDPVVFPTPDTAWSPKGPNWIQIGSEGGFLPAPVVIPASPTVWVTDPTRFDVGNVDYGSLILAPAERADVIVDFSRFRGKTLILYNDAPAAFPARVPSYDYYTGAPDLSPVGVPSVLPGYGPNTRTIMKVKISTATAAVQFDSPTNTTTDRMALLNKLWRHGGEDATGSDGVFESGQNPIIVGQSTYNSAYGTNFVSSGWCSDASPSPTANCDGYARIMEQNGRAEDLSIGRPADTFGTPFKFNTLGPLKDGNGPQLEIGFEPKSIHDEMNSASFDEFGRMTANLGLEAPGATPLLQNIILYPYVSPPTEVLSATNANSLDVTPISSAADGTQIWKITHNGVDTHPIHFHLYDVQVLNRVSWDNIVQPPAGNELGWKDTLRINPLQDTIVAVRPIIPKLPFGLPESKRVLNPMMPTHAQGDPNANLGLEAGFSNIWIDGNAIPANNYLNWPTNGGLVSNEVFNFGWEYVFHCHILSHEEMDMMRPVKVIVPTTVPDAPVLSTAGAPGSPVTLSWTDGTPVNYAIPSTWGDMKGEIGYRVERAIVSGGITGAYDLIASPVANATSYVDNLTDANSHYKYRVTAFNASGDSLSNEVQVDPLLVVSIVRQDANPTNLATVNYTVTFSDVVTGVDTADFTLTTTGLTGAVVSSVTGAGTTRSVAVSTGTGDGTLRLDLTDNDTIQGSLGQLLGGSGLLNGDFTTGEVYDVDKTAPSVTSIARASANPTNAVSVDYTVTFDESVANVSAADFEITMTGGLTGASVSNVTGTGAIRTVTINTGTGDGTLRLDILNTATIDDTAGNAFVGPYTGGEIYNISKSAPTVISINRLSTNPNNFNSVVYTVTFSTSVVNVGNADFTLNTTGVTGASIFGVTGTGATRSVTVLTGTGSGTIRLDILNTATINDTSGNALIGPYTGGQVFTIDKTVPTVTSINRVNANPTNLNSVVYTVTFSESVLNAGGLDFTLTTTGGVTGASIFGVSGTGATRSVTVLTGTGTGTIRLDVLNTATINDDAGNALVGPYTGGQVYTVDKTIPTVVSINRVSANPTRQNSVVYTVTFSEAVVNVGGADFSLTTTGITGASVFGVTGTGTTRNVTVLTGTGTGTIKLDVTVAATINDTAGNALVGPFTGGQVFDVDKTIPTVVSITRVNPSTTNLSSVQYTVTFSEAVLNAGGADFVVTTTGGITGASVFGSSGTGTTRTVTVLTGTGNGTIRLDVRSTATINDVAGNALVGPYTGGAVYTIVKP
ncbi:multicopper oxidase domain-containing protein [Candidatus Villigracilis saccharophilus]|uniref:multicopper oxidase domain-containing protein n=1 Tax=Candidatus Villigracilis saccharophilus TaxID=3140684 RepID=UPI0031F1C19F